MTVALLMLVVQSFPAQLTGFERRWEEIKRQASAEELYRILWDLPKGGDLHNHHEYSVPMREWLERAATKLYYTRVRTSVCAGEEPLAFYTIRASTYESLPACVRQDYKRLSDLTSAERAAWISAMELDQPGESRDELFERIVRRLGELERDPVLMTDLLLVQIQQAREEGLLYLETQFDPRGFRNPDGTRRARIARRRMSGSACARFRPFRCAFRFPNFGLRRTWRRNWKARSTSFIATRIFGRE